MSLISVSLLFVINVTIIGGSYLENSLMVSTAYICLEFCFRKNKTIVPKDSGYILNAKFDRWKNTNIAITTIKKAWTWSDEQWLMN